MRFKKTVFSWVICVIITSGMYGFFATPSIALAGSSQDENVVNTKDDYTVEKLGKDLVNDELEVHFIDVGQADCTLIKCNGCTMLIDTGLDDQGTKIQNYLKKQGIDRLDYLILTHSDIDHIGSADVIMTKFDIGTIFMSDFEKETKTYKNLLKLIEENDIRYLSPAVGNVYAFGSASFQILAPNDAYDKPNNTSIAFLLTHGENTFLFTGDAEKEAEFDMLNNGLNLAADVLHAGHRGSRTSNTQEFVDAVMPRYAVISCGEDNAFGLPDAEVLNRFREKEMMVYRTDEQGTIVAVSNGEKITFNTAPITDGSLTKVTNVPAAISAVSFNSCFSLLLATILASALTLISLSSSTSKMNSSISLVSFIFASINCINAI